MDGYNRISLRSFYVMTGKRSEDLQSLTDLYFSALRHIRRLTFML